MLKILEKRIATFSRLRHFVYGGGARPPEQSPFATSNPKLGRPSGRLFCVRSVSPL